MSMPDVARPESPSPWSALRAGLLSALAYAGCGGLGVALAGSPGFGVAPYTLAGMALAVALVWGRPAVVGTWLGAAALQLGVAWSSGNPATGGSPLLFGGCVAVQAAVGAALVNRRVGRPLLLTSPREITRFALYGAVVASAVGATLTTPLLLASHAVAGAAPAGIWLSWFAGNTVGTLVGAPLVLSFVGRPRAEWRDRRRTVGLPLLLALSLLALLTAELGRLDRQRQQAEFRRDADHLGDAVQDRLAAPLDALQALHSAALASGGMDERRLRQASRWWLARPIQLQAMGYSERVALADLPAFVERARDEIGPGYRVFDRDGGAARAADGEVVAVRGIDPLEGNQAALGINSLSIPAARAALLAARDSGMPSATAAFTLTQASNPDAGVVLCQPLYRGEPSDLESRRKLFRGAVFVTLRIDRTLAGIAPANPPQRRLCLVDPDPHASRHRLAGPPGCDTEDLGRAAWAATRAVQLADRTLELRIAATHAEGPGVADEVSSLRRIAGLTAAAMLAALLLTVTGSRRRTQLAVLKGTAELRRQMDERALVQAALADSESRLRSILDHVPIGVMFLDPQGRLIACNPRLGEMVGCRPEDLRDTLVTDLVQPEERPRLLAMRRALLAGDPDCRLDRLQLRARGAIALVVRVSASALRDPEGAVVRVVCVLQDITEHLQLEASELARHRAEAASRAKSEFVSRMSHELRTPLNAMLGFAQLLGLDRGQALGAQQRDWVQQIQRAGWHLLEMINETLDLARIESGAVHLQIEAVPLGPLVASSLSMLAAAAQQRGVTLVEDLKDPSLAVRADATRLKQVLINLLGNAVKYNRDGGSATLAAHRVPGDAGERIAITVSDTGIGMSAEQLGELFQAYNRLGRESSGIEGTGIGLVISHRLTELMGGTLEASSEAGRGSVFTLRLAAAARVETPAEPPVEPASSGYRQRVVHYVEDNETNIEVMRGIFLQRPQIRLETSTLGLDGLAAIRRGHPDLVLLDMQLPDISGLELLRHLKQDDSLTDIPVIVVSADATAGNMEAALVAGAAHYMTKPLEMREFLQTLDTLLETVETRWGV